MVIISPFSYKGFRLEFVKFFDVICVIGSLQGPSKGNGTVIYIFPEKDTNVN